MNVDLFDISNWMDYGWMCQQMVSENHVLVILETVMVLQKPIPYRLLLKAPVTPKSPTGDKDQD